MAGGINLFAYTGNNPINYFDSLGLSPNSSNCRRLLKKINNIRKKIDERLGELHEDPQNLPERADGDCQKPSRSRYGHREVLIKKDKARLAELKAKYLSKCGGDPPYGSPQGGDDFFDDKFWGDPNYDPDGITIPPPIIVPIPGRGGGAGGVKPYQFLPNVY